MDTKELKKRIKLARGVYDRYLQRGNYVGACSTLNHLSSLLTQLRLAEKRNATGQAG